MSGEHAFSLICSFAGIMLTACAGFALWYEEKLPVCNIVITSNARSAAYLGLMLFVLGVAILVV